MSRLTLKHEQGDSMFFHRIPAILSTLVCAACFSTVASAATITQITSQSQVGTYRTTFTSKDAPGTTYGGPSAVFNNGNNRLTFSRDGGGYETDQVGYNYGSSAFSNGTVLVGAGGFQGSGAEGPVKLTFTVPVIQFALNIEDFDLSANGTNNPYFIDFSAYDPGNNLLGTFQSTSGCSNNSCLSLEGLTVSGSSIGAVVFSNSNAASTNNFLFGNVSYVNVGTALQAPAVTPEPSSFVLLGTGLVSMATLGRRKLARSRNA